MNEVSVDVITRTAALNDLRSEWELLWEDCPEASPFQHPFWLLCWWEKFGTDKRLSTLTFRSNGHLVGIAPLCLLSEGGIRKVMPIGVGLSDYIDCLFATPFRKIAVHELFDYLADREKDWDLCEFMPLPSDSLLLLPCSPNGILSVIEPVDTLTTLEIPSGCVHSSISAHFSDRLKEAHARASRLGEVQFEIQKGPLIAPAMDHLSNFRRLRWNHHSPLAEQFFRATAEEFARRSELRLYTLTINHRIVSVLYGFVQRGRGYLYLTGFDPDYKKISPGVLLIISALESLLAEGISRCEFLRGREAFKYRWKVKERLTYVRRLQSTPLKNAQ